MVFFDSILCFAIIISQYFSSSIGITDAFSFSYSHSSINNALQKQGASTIINDEIKPLSPRCSELMATRKKESTNNNDDDNDSEDINTPKNNDDQLYIRFSDCYQRYIVYRKKFTNLSNVDRYKKEIVPSQKTDILQSFLFLDEALSTYPDVILDESNNRETGGGVKMKHEELQSYFHNKAGSDIPSNNDNNNDNSTKKNLESMERKKLRIDSLSLRKMKQNLDMIKFISDLLENSRSSFSPSQINQGLSSDEIYEYLAEKLYKSTFWVQQDTTADDASLLLKNVPKTKFEIRRKYHLLLDLFTRHYSQFARQFSSSPSSSPNNNNNNNSGGEPNGGLSPGLAMNELGARSLLSAHPEMLLFYDYDEIVERIKFLISPKPPSTFVYASRSSKDQKIDYPLLSSMGYGAGLSLNQATIAVSTIPTTLLSLSFENPLTSQQYTLYADSSFQATLGDTNVRNYLPTLIGSNTCDLLTFGFLHNNCGIHWDTLNILLDAFPTFTHCDLEVSWEILSETSCSRSASLLYRTRNLSSSQNGDNGSIWNSTNNGDVVVRNVLKEDCLTYLRKRLQIGTKEIMAMIKTHTRLSTYSVDGKIKPILDTLQTSLSLSSRELKQIVLRMPSIIGMSKDSYQKRLDFFLEDVGMTKEELKCAVLKQPSLPQYNVDNNLRPKLDYFTNELHIPKSHIPRILKESPSILGLSLEHNLKPKIKAIQRECCFESDMMIAEILVTSPRILLQSLKTKIDPMLLFLRLSFFSSDDDDVDQNTNSVDLGYMILKSPRVLTQSIDSVQTKIQMIEDALANEEETNNQSFTHYQTQARMIIRNNPNLLVITNKVLKDRLHKLTTKQKNKRPLHIALLPKTNGRKREFVLVKDKKKQKNITEKNVPAPQSQDDEATDLLVPCAFIVSPADRILKPLSKTVKDKILNSSLVIPYSSPWTPLSSSSSNNKEKSVVPLSVYVSGNVYPTDNSKEARGQRRSGGVSLYFPQIHYSPSSGNIQSWFSNAAESSFGILVPSPLTTSTSAKSSTTKTISSSYLNHGRILVAFPYLRPSRNRCDLYACHAALKVLLQLTKSLNNNKEGQKNIFQDKKHVKFNNIDILTNSEYCWNLLKDSDKLYRWGEREYNLIVREQQRKNRLYKTADNEQQTFFKNNDEELMSLPASLTPYNANLDILYPLAFSYYRLVRNLSSLSNKGNHQVEPRNIKFLHTGEINIKHREIDYDEEMKYFSKQAALWQHERAKMI